MNKHPNQQNASCRLKRNISTARVRYNTYLEDQRKAKGEMRSHRKERKSRMNFMMCREKEIESTIKIVKLCTESRERGSC